MAITVSALLWARPGREQALISYEDTVLALLDDHRATLVSRLRSDGSDGQPFEIQVFEFPSDLELDEYLGDPRRTALAFERDEAVARTQLIRVERIT
jgi:hypothetical protein